jgi:AcrR family transcriptional regulator
MNTLNDVCPDSLQSGQGKGRDGANSVGMAPVDYEMDLGAGGLKGPVRRMSAAEPSPSKVPSRAPTRRALAKQQTRSRIIEAARRLFSEHGYEGATIRDIAAAANMSTGAVFANFADKYDLFRDILELETEDVVEIMQGAATGATGVEDVLSRMFQASFARYQGMLPLARATFAVAISPQGLALADGECIGRFLRLFREPLEAAVARGELRGDCNIQLLNEMLWEAYLSNILRMIYQGATPEAALDRARAQFSVLLAGVRID